MKKIIESTKSPALVNDAGGIHWFIWPIAIIDLISGNALGQPEARLEIHFD